MTHGAYLRCWTLERPGSRVPTLERGNDGQLSLPFKGRAGVGMGANQVCLNPPYTPVSISSPGRITPPVITLAKIPSFGMTQSPAW